MIYIFMYLGGPIDHDHGNFIKSAENYMDRNDTVPESHGMAYLGLYQ